jgi:Sulfotransferase family
VFDKLRELREGPQREEHLRQELDKANERIVRQRHRIKRLKERGQEPTSVRAGQIVWIFGSGRTGSSWLSRMMASLPDHSRWNEPAVGNLFGDLYEHASFRHERENFILADQHREVWLRAARSLVLESASARFPERLQGGYVFVKEPHGSIGAPLMMEALPESRMIFLIRDPRDVVASALDAHKPGSWATKRPKLGDEMAENDPDQYVAIRAEGYLRDILKTNQAYKAHEGRKVVVKYENLRADPLGTMRRIYSALEIPAKEKQLARAVKKHSWENIPEERKGAGKIFRKATPGGWREDLTPEQVRIVEKVTHPIIEEFYS